MKRGPIIKMIIVLVVSFLMTSCGQEPAIIQMKETPTDSGQTVAEISNEANAHGSSEANLQMTVEESLQVGDGTNHNETGAIRQTKIFTHVCGAVVNPGVYEMSSDSRVFEAIEMAGGFTGEAYQPAINLADTLADGQQLVVPTKEEVANAPNQAMTSIGNAGNLDDTGNSDGLALININTADITLLQELNGIGEAKAKEILAYRDRNGGFNHIEDIKNVSGIGDKLYERIKENITVS